MHAYLSRDGSLLTPPPQQLFPHVKYVIDKYRHKLPKDDLKRLGKDVNKKLVSSDFKRNRVQDPTAPLDQKQSRKVKSYVKDFLDKAVVKLRNYEKAKAARHTDTGKSAEPGSAAQPADSDTVVADVADEVMLSDDDEAESATSPEKKRKRDEETRESPSMDPLDGPLAKRLRENDAEDGAPPPPPPPPAEPAPVDSPLSLSEEQQALREQEEALMRENEESERLEEEATKAHEPGNNLEGSADGHSRVNGGVIVAGEGEPAGGSDHK